MKKLQLKNQVLLVGLSLLVLACQPSSEKAQVTYYQSEEMAALGLPFSDAVIVDNMVYVSGQVGNLPGKLELAEGGIRGETIQAMKNLQSVLEATGSSLDHVVKVTVMLADINEWSVFNEEYVKFFPNNKPARSAFGTQGLALGARLELECIALVKD